MNELIKNKFGFGGMVFPQEGDMLKNYAKIAIKENPINPILIEIGSYSGSSTAYISEAVFESDNILSKFYAIDTFKSSNPELEDKDTLELFKNNLRNVNLLEYVEPLVMENKFAVKNFKDSSCCFLFLDGSHELDDVIEDLTNWLPKMKENSIVAVHDCYNFDGVKYALFRFENILDEINTTATLKIFRIKRNNE